MEHFLRIDNEAQGDMLWVVNGKEIIRVTPDGVLHVADGALPVDEVARQFLNLIHESMVCPHCEGK